MPTVRSNRTRFDADIGDRLNTVLILAGDANSKAQAVHDAARKLVHAYRKTWILRDVSVLDEDEQELWVKAPEKYAVYNCDKKETRAWGPVSQLLGADGKPDILKIRSKFAEAEL